MPGRRWSDGLHQAVEAKEGVQVQNENQTLASITFQNYFRLYEKLSGMTGTADTEAKRARDQKAAAERSEEEATAAKQAAADVAAARDWGVGNFRTLLAGVARGIGSRPPTAWSEEDR